jgi:hypothetical protein
MADEGGGSRWLSEAEGKDSLFRPHGWGRKAAKRGEAREGGG